MSSADRRIADMLERWLASLDLHLRYVDLDDEAYRRVQSWPAHDRPNRWILELAKQKVLDLKTQCEARQAMGDIKFAEALEAANFLSTLVGLQNVKRFIPLATADAENKNPPAQESQPGSSTATVQMKNPRGRPADDSTREMPKMKSAGSTAKARPAEQKKPQPKPESKAADAKSSLTEVEEKVLADAIRLLKWGRQWHELPELVARIADRPPLSEVRRFLRVHKNSIESQAKSDP